MDRSTLEELKLSLEENRGRLRREIGELREATKATTYLEDETDAYDQHIADDASILTERTTDMSLMQNLEQELASVESALKRMDLGHYGTCEVCGRPIAEARLKARPSSSACIECQTDIEARQRREGAARLDTSS